MSTSIRMESTFYETCLSLNCKVNQISVDELVEVYRKLRFIYPAKEAALSPYYSLILENWKKALKADQSIFQILTYGNPEHQNFASVMFWRNTNTSWMAQHLISSGGGLSGIPMLAAQGTFIKEPSTVPQHNALKVWYRPANKFAHKAFGSTEEVLGKENAVVNPLDYMAVNPKKVKADHRIKVVECNDENQQLAIDFAAKCLGKAYVKAEEIDGNDLNLNGLKDVYERVGLTRKRKILLAFRANDKRPVGMIVANRVPLGFNFSFLGNCSEILLNPHLSMSDAEAVTTSLLAEIKSLYEDFELPYIPAVINHAYMPVLLDTGIASFIRQYSQSIWLKDGFCDWYQSLYKMYSLYRARFSQSA